MQTEQGGIKGRYQGRNRGIPWQRAAEKDQVEQHDKQTGRTAYAGVQVDHLQGRTNRMLCCMRRSRNHAIGMSFVHHHGAKIGGIRHPVPGHILDHTSVLTQRYIGLNEIIEQRAGLGIDHLDPGEVEPIGRGQRELILGDRQTGKTAIAIDTIIQVVLMKFVEARK